MRNLRVRQIDLNNNYEHVKIHTFPLPEFKDQGFYRTITSYSAFFESAKMRNKSSAHLFLAIDENIYNTASTEFEKERDRNLPVVQHKDLLSFFEYIGYDRKTKKYSV